jgi:hypothetical protein
VTGSDHVAQASELLAQGGQRFGLESLADYDRRIRLAQTHALTALAAGAVGDMPSELRRLDAWVKTHDEEEIAFSLQYQTNTKPDRPSGWYCALEWGKEADDSPMVGAASYGAGDTALEALTEVLQEIKA